MKEAQPYTVKLPEPRFESDVSLEEALLFRRSVRRYGDEALTLGEVSQLLWAGQGITSPHGFRTAPSAGACYPLETYLIAGKIDGLAAGVYKYRSQDHELTKIQDGDAREQLALVAARQKFIGRAPFIIVFAAVYERTTNRYGDRGVRYVHMDAALAAENVHLQAAALKLGTVICGAFDDKAVQQVLSLPADERPLIIMPVGKKGAR